VLVRTRGNPLIVWRIVVGAVLIFGNVRAALHPSGNVFQAGSREEQLGMNVAYCVMTAVGCWLVWSGVRPSPPLRPK
jgi:uncharacterized membrane protein YecN with MAPEG domain